MTKMKDYVDQILEGLEETQENHELTAEDFEESLDTSVCPFCHSEEYMIVIQKMPEGKSYLHTCRHCKRSWLLEINGLTGEGRVGEIDLSQLVDFPGLPE